MTTIETRTLTDEIAVREERDGYAHLDRDETIAAIRSALKRRSGKAWSVKGGRGTGAGWISIDAPPRRKTAHWVDKGRRDAYGNVEYDLEDTGELGGYMTPADAEELRELLSLDRVHHQGVSIAASTGHRVEYVARAEGRSPSTFGVQYWD